ncbi:MULTISPECIES: hypothetical protein [unclassified Acinetobacter]|uniref:hypothetical protein n=1 Tax=unclassified Acinetobacter TaxID=196816 RepID=UPI0035BA6860
MQSHQFYDLVEQTIDYYFRLALKHYPDLSAFAIVSTESFECFSIAINHAEYFQDYVAGKMDISDEDFWNTAEWTRELFDMDYAYPAIDEINQLLNDDLVSEHDFLSACHLALKAVRQKYQKNEICLFLHLTDLGSSDDLFSIVMDLNTPEMSKDYLNYYADYL